MKLVVTGTSGVTSARIARSIANSASSASEEKRWKSSCWVGLEKVGAVRGGLISSQRS